MALKMTLVSKMLKPCNQYQNKSKVKLKLIFMFSQATMQVYPPKPEDEVPLTRLQERLRKKLGTNAYPFKFEVCSDRRRI